MPVYRGPGGAGDATNDATVTAVQAAATSAATSATNAANSATAAATSASGASTSATNAANSATSSAGSATSSANSATTSAGYATNSSLSADDSAASAVEAAGYASDAFDYSVAASVSSGTASDYADSAIAASASAYAHELAAAASASDAADSYADTLAIFGDATDVADAVAAAQLAESNASASADAAAASAVTAAGSASSAATQAVNAAASAATADAEATSAGASAVDAAQYAADASDYADEAQGYAGDALDAYQNTLAVYNDLETVEAAVANSLANRDAAAASATAASNSASTATTQAGLATTQATNAAASAAAASAVALGNEPVRHSVRPSLLLDFANTKTLDPRITFSRASTGTYYDGKTTVKAEQNLLLQSQTFDTVVTGWTVDGITLSANNTAAPDGTMTAELLTATAVNQGHYVYNSTGNKPTVANTTYTLSVFAKANGYNYVTVSLGGTGSTVFAAATFDLSTVAVTKTGNGAGGGNLTSSSITPVGNGWYRLAVTGSVTQSAGFILFGLNTSGTPAYGNYGLETFTGDGTSGLFLWGAQLEQRDTVTAYTATTTAPITNYIPALQTATSGTARFDHNPTTGESLGLLIEEQRTNLALQSEDFSTTWADAQTTSTTKLTNQIVAPDGNLSADLLLNTTATNRHTITQAFTFADGTANYSASLYVKKYIGSGSDTFVAFYLGDAFQGSNRAGIVVNTTDWTIGNSSLSTGTATLSSSSITHVGNNWYRLTISGNLGISGSTNARVCIGVSNLAPSTPIANSYAGDGYSGIYIWGAQLEAGAFATSYIPTVASQVTRSADSASMTGTNFSSWYNQQEGTMYAESGKTINVGGTIDYIVSANDGTTTRDIFLYRGGSSVNLFVVDSTTQANISSSFSASSTEYFKVVGTYAVNDFATSLNSSTASTDTLGTLPAVTQLMIGQPPSSTGGRRSLNGTIRKFAYYPARLSNAEIQSLTVI